MMPCECVVLQLMEAREEGKPNRKAARVLAAAASSSSSNGAGSEFSNGSNKCKSEVIFPIYVRGSSKRNSITRTILDFAGDPIWEAVKSEAKSEVRNHCFVSELNCIAYCGLMVAVLLFFPWVPPSAYLL
jgi:serine O-acetyltransferase